MIAPLIMASRLVLAAVVALTATVAGAGGSSHHRNEAVALNQASLKFARNLIIEDHVVNDKRGEWATHQAAARYETEFIRQNGSEEYARWFLGIDASHSVDTKARYKFPFGDFKNV